MSKRFAIAKTIGGLALLAVVGVWLLPAPVVRESAAVDRRSVVASWDGQQHATAVRVAAEIGGYHHGHRVPGW